MAEAADTQNLEQGYRFVDGIEGVAELRQQERLGAVALLDGRRQRFATTGEVDFLPVDALSTAHEVLEAEKTSGLGSPDYEDKLSGLVLDCQRLLAEWYRKKKPEYFPSLRHIFNEKTEEFFSHGLSIAQMTSNALVPIPDNPEEENRRINEKVEDATPRILKSLGKIAIGTESIRTISECTDKAVNDYAYDQRNKLPHTGYGGYVPEIEKVMVRDMKLDKASNDRFEEQIALPGIYITHEIIKIALAKRGLDASTMDKTTLHGAQIVAGDDLIDFVALLDTVASEQWCTNIFMGEEVSKGHHKNYMGFRQEALARQEGLKDMAKITANFVLGLARDNFDRRKAPAHVENFVKKQLLDIAKKDFVVAEQMFDIETAQGLQAVAALEQQGKYQESFALMQEIGKKAPGGGSCGGGSCGLEDVDLNSEFGKDIKSKLKADDGDKIVKDKERACKCGAKEIVYAYSKTKVNKYCTSCKAFETKKTTGVKSDD
jgi:hypothetical protein